MRSGALRQPPQLPEVAWTGWSRLEPVAPARELKTHKGRRRLTARVSLRGAAGVGAGPCPSPSLCQVLGPHCGADSLRVPETDLGLGERSHGGDYPSPASFPVLPSPRSRFSRVETSVREVPGAIFSRPSGLAQEAGWALCRPGTGVFPRILETQPQVLTPRCLTELFFCGETPGGAFK